MSLFVRLLPGEWRARYGPEIDAALRVSRHGFADRVDVLWLAAYLRGEEFNARMNMRWMMKRLWILLVGFLLVVGGAGAAMVSAQLDDGLREVPNHWWSSGAVSPAFSGVLLLSYQAVRRWHTHRPEAT